METVEAIVTTVFARAVAPAGPPLSLSKAGNTMPSRPWRKRALLAVLAIGILLELRVLAAFASIPLVFGDEAFLDWFPSGWAAIGALGGIAWLRTRDATLGAPQGEARLRGSRRVTATLWGLFAGVTCFSLLTFYTYSFDRMSIHYSVRPAWSLFNPGILVLSTVIALLGGRMSHGWLGADRPVGSPAPSAVSHPAEPSTVRRSPALSETSQPGDSEPGSGPHP